MPRPSVACRDGSNAIANAIEEAWEGMTQVNCWAHVVRNYEKKVDSLVKESSKASKEAKENAKKLRNIIKSDIPKIQLCPTIPMFKAVTALWKNQFQEIAMSSAFVDYFDEQYISNETMMNWFEGAAPKNPSTNNCNESGNNVYKRLFTLFAQGTVLRVVNSNHHDVLPFWSKFRNDDNENFEKYHFKPSSTDYELTLWGLASIFKKNMKTHVRKSDGHFIWRNDDEELSENEGVAAIDLFCKTNTRW